MNKLVQFHIIDTNHMIPTKKKNSFSHLFFTSSQEIN